jgi:hypothetical protein
MTNINQNKFNESPRKQYIKNRIVENLSDSRYGNKNNFPIFDMQMQHLQNVCNSKSNHNPNSDNKNFPNKNNESLHSLNNNNNLKNMIDSKNLYMQNYMNMNMNMNMNYGNINNNIIQMNQVNFNLMKNHFENLQIKSEMNNNNFTNGKPNITNDFNQNLNFNKNLMMNINPNQKEYLLYQNLTFDNHYKMMMIQNNQKFKENNFENSTKHENENMNRNLNGNDNSNKTKIKMTNNQNPKCESKKIKKPFIEREGDWFCLQCKNLNFSFRGSCNRCQISKEDNEILKSK